MTSAHLLTSEDVEHWKNLDTASHVFFQKHSWNDLLSEAYSYKDFSLAASDADKGFTLLPLKLVRSRLLGDRLISAPFSDFAGPTDPDLPGQKLLLDAATRLSNRLNADFLEIRLNRSHSKKLISEMEHLGFKLAREYASFSVDLRGGEKKSWQRVSSATRRAITRSRGSGVEVREVETRRDLQSYYALYQESSREHGSPAHSLAFISMLFSKLGLEGQVRLLLASRRDEDLAGLLLFRHASTVHYWQSALPSQNRAHNPFHLLMWEVFSSAAAEGYEFFDLGRTRRKSGIYKFKQSWGGIEYRLGHYCLFKGKPRVLPDPEDLRYRTASLIWKRLPRSVAPKWGHRIIREIAL